MSEWKETTLGEIAEYINRGFSPKYVETDGEMVINQKCIRDGRINFLLTKLTDMHKPITSEKILKKGDILINSTGVGTAGRIAQFNEESIATADSHITIVRIK